eukprot:1149248-Pelagomonas_calceolata.AAC.6
MEAVEVPGLLVLDMNLQLSRNRMCKHTYYDACSIFYTYISTEADYTWQSGDMLIEVCVLNYLAQETDGPSDQTRNP